MCMPRPGTLLGQACQYSQEHRSFTEQKQIAPYCLVNGMYIYMCCVNVNGLPQTVSE